MQTVERYTEKEFLGAEFPDGEPVLEGLLYKGQNILLVAPQKSAKTMLSMQLGLSVAHGLPFLGKWQSPHAQRVLFVACEGTNDELQDMMKRQIRALDIQEDGKLVIVRTPYMHLNTASGESTLRGLVDSERPDLLILDPLYRLHKGSVNNDDLVADTTAVLNDLGQHYGHATWMPHHEHKERHDQFGMAFEDRSSRYAGSWALGAWCSSMFGFQFAMKKKTASLSAYFERKPRLQETISLTLEDTEGQLLFHVGLHERLVVDINTAPEKIFGKGIAEAATDYGQDKETFRRTLIKLQADGHLILVPGGPGRQTMIGAIT